MLFAGVLLAEVTTYTLTFEGRWANDLTRPSNAHFSPFIGSTHNAQGGFTAIGQLASTGVEDVAEIGSTGALRNEISDLIMAGNADQLIARAGGSGPVETLSMDIEVDSDFALLSVITMIAPSPDWFVGVQGLNLLDGNGNWINHIALDLNNYDAGTEDGIGFSTSNSPSDPRSVIRELDQAEPMHPLRNIGSISTLTLTRAVPEPSSLLLLSAAGIGFCVRRKRV